MDTGLDRFARGGPFARRLRDTRVGVLAHPASVTRDLVHIGAVLDALAIRPVLYFGPEHGYGGEAQDMIGVSHSRDRRGIPVRSLYGDHFEDLCPTPADLAELDVLLIDLQDVGSRYYTFVWTALIAMRAGLEAGKRVIVLDRPNPLGGDPRDVEGRSQLAAFRSFVGLEAIPVRHSLTLGEVLAYFAHKDDFSTEQLSIVAVRDCAPEVQAPRWDRPFVQPSPNMPTYDTALVYPGGCLLEGTNLSEGRGTTRPFEVFGAPFLDGDKLAREFHDIGLPGVRVRGLSFRPTFHKFAGEVCGGVQVHPTDPTKFRPVATYLALIALAHEQDPGKFAFRTERYEFVDDIPAFDLLTGDGQARAMISQGAKPADVANTIGNPRPADAELVREARRVTRTYEATALD